MLLSLFLGLALSQDADAKDARLARLDDEDVSVREKATQDLIAIGPSVVDKLLSFYNTTRSSEARSRAEMILGRYPFEAFARISPEVPFRESLKEALLADAKKHRDTKGCWLDEGERPNLQVSRLRIVWQNGSGHGQYLAIIQIAPHEKGGLTARRVAYQGTTPYRPHVKQEGVHVEEAQLDPEETKALAILLKEGTALRKECAIPRESGRAWFSSGSFSMRFRIESENAAVWDAAYTGYPGSLNEKEYAHGEILERVLYAATAHRPWAEARLTPEDRARVLQWITDNFPDEGWWIREHYLDMALFIGDATYLTFLRKAAKELEGKSDPSEKRQLESVQKALLRIDNAKE